jgi:DUF1365 family protein
MHSALYTGWVSHRRRAPREHAFRYPLFMVLLDLAELPTVFRGRWLWGVERRSLASFRRADHLAAQPGDEARPLETCVRELVEQQCGRRPDGPIRLLTHLRYFGYGFNPVSFYYCFDAADAEVVAIVAEVNNTPWGERQCYVLDAAQGGAGAPGAAGVRSWHTAKQMHVSPFMPMDLQYEWRLSQPGQALAVHMRCSRAGELLFDATLALRRRPITGRVLAGTLLRFPWMTARVIVAIHWQALRLWLKGVPVHDHPAGHAARALEQVK